MGNFCLKTWSDSPNAIFLASSQLKKLDDIQGFYEFLELNFPNSSSLLHHDDENFAFRILHVKS